MNIRLATDVDRNRWNAYADSSDTPPLARYEWRNILEKTYSVATYFFIAQDEQGVVKGICPTYVSKLWGGKSMLYSLRFGLLADDETIRAVLLSHIQQFCYENQIASYLVTSGYVDSISNARIKKTIIMKIADEEEELWNSLRNKTRNMIRKAQHAGIHIKRGFENLEEFYRVYVQRMLEKGVPIHRLDFFTNIVKALPDNAELLCAMHERRLVGGLLLLIGKKTSIYPYQASLREGEQLASNQLLIWEAMRYCRERGIAALDMGESTEGSTVYQSKINFGGKPKEVYYYHTIGEPASSPLPFVSKMFPYLPSVLKTKVGIWLKKQGRLL